MFYCNTCGEKRGWPDGLVRSQGNCEMCGNFADCSEVPSSSLPDPKVATVNLDDFLTDKDPNKLYCSVCKLQVAELCDDVCPSCSVTQDDEEPSKHHVMNVVNDLVANLLYYDRKGDEDLPVGAIEKMIKEGKLTTDEIVERFKTMLEKGI